jgi:alkyl hydroperoxide reductase subunit AhpC
VVRSQESATSLPKRPGFPLRSVTVIDPQGVVRARHVHPLDALPKTDKVLGELASSQSAQLP